MQIDRFKNSRVVSMSVDVTALDEDGTQLDKKRVSLTGADAFDLLAQKTEKLANDIINLGFSF